ncbi:MAG: hypothetical protein AAF514_01115 [Verrucomicrobiota bacterium]
MRHSLTGFNERDAVVVYRRKLSHWRQEGATYFIISRMADALRRACLSSGMKRSGFGWLRMESTTIHTGTIVIDS